VFQVSWAIGPRAIPASFNAGQGEAFVSLAFCLVFTAAHCLNLIPRYVLLHHYNLSGLIVTLITLSPLLFFFPPTYFYSPSAVPAFSLLSLILVMSSNIFLTDFKFIFAFFTTHILAGGEPPAYQTSLTVF
jgi:hypothetical protein